MENNRNNNQEGTGSAENTDRDRNDQQNPKTDLSNEERRSIASEIGEDESRISSIKDMGGISGRDDASGGTGDGMENQSTGQTTDW